MAELPDLTVFAAILTRKFKDQLVKRIEVTVARKLNVSAEELQKTLEGEELTVVQREGKTLQFHFSNEQVLGLHLMLRGELVEIVNAEVPRFQIMAFHFGNGKGFAVTDLQKQATATLRPKVNEVPDALALGKEAFLELLSKKRTVIKTLLMDQQQLRGIGNSYADEILYHARISPFSVANAIPTRQAAQLYESLQTVLHSAIDQIAEANGDELTGELKDFMQVHGARIKETAKGEMVKNDQIGGRRTYYTDTQQLYT